MLMNRNVLDIDSHVGKRINGGRVYIVAPSTRVDFITDYQEIENTKYYFLKIPYQMIKELHQKPFQKFRQPQSKEGINALDESIGFSFNRIQR
jgi:site-specific DNA-methyltransferase (adenine-specific)/adenine-specific DNA-methyltransferase